MHPRFPMFVKIWFALDVLLAWFPPFHWAASGAAPVFGVPRSLWYLFGVELFIAASAVAACCCDPTLGPGHRQGR